MTTRSLAGLLVAAVVAAACSAGPGADSVATAPADADTGATPSAGPRPRALLSEVPPLHPSVDDWERADVVVRTGPDDSGLLIRVLVAATPEQRAHGLMEVPSLPDGAGMVFTYEDDRTGAFWMKGTLVPLDIAWVSATGTVVAVATMTPCEAEPCPTWAPGAAYRLALEVPAGFLDRYGVAEGATVELR